MTTVELRTHLAAHRSLGGAPSEELAWLAEHGTSHSFQVGDVLTRKGQREEWLRIVLAGHIAIHVDRGAGSRKIIEWRAGDVCGLMPYSRGGSPPGATVAEQPTETLSIPAALFPEMMRECPGVTAILVHAMLDRARHFTSSDHLDEKLLSLGKLAAGLAHELNNPASAAARTAKLLVSASADAEAAGRALAAAGATAAQLAAIDRVRGLCATANASAGLSAIERADRVDAIGGWLDAHQVDADIASPLAETDVTIGALDALAGALAGGPLDAALRWIASGCAVRALASEIDTSASRIYALVAAVKGFTYMDRAPTPEAVDVARGVVDTVAVLGGKARAKSVTIGVHVAANLPRARAFGGELNQIWANLLDNALDAVAVHGHVDVTASEERDQVVVQVVDDGPGIPRELRDRIFDPFFTTKPVGEGTGLGLDIVRRLVQRQDGEIEVESRPGRTEFRVRLRAAENAPLARPS